MSLWYVAGPVKGAKWYGTSLEESHLSQSAVTRHLSSGVTGGVAVDLQDGFLGDRVEETRSG